MKTFTLLVLLIALPALALVLIVSESLTALLFFAGRLAGIMRASPPRLSPVRRAASLPLAI